jgi:predicted RNA-binding protein with PUA domain
MTKCPMCKIKMKKENKLYGGKGYIYICDRCNLVIEYVRRKKK